MELIQYLVHKLGINMIREAPKRINEMLPTEMRNENPQGHSIRGTLYHGINKHEFW
jgi:hypothetical protein